MKEHNECNKKCYPSRSIAKKALKVVKKKYRKSREQNVHLCLKCDAWHLTSLTRENSRNLDNWKNKNLRI